jgi:hypothetical protein
MDDWIYDWAAFIGRMLNWRSALFLIGVWLLLSLRWHLRRLLEQTSYLIIVLRRIEDALKK